jgi:hypothetical protein
MRTSNFGILLLVLIMAAVGVGNSPVSADPCAVTLSPSATMTAQHYNYYNSYIGVILPISVTCSFVGGQLYAVGDVSVTTATSANTHVGQANTALVSSYGVSTYTGQFTFSLPATVVGQTLQISVSVYNGVIGSYMAPGPALATAVGTVQVNPNNSIPYANCYATNSCNQVYNYCRPTSDPSTMQCTGYLYQDPNGCVELVISVYSPYGFLSYQYYSLQKLPASYPAIGTTVTVTGQVVQGSNLSSTGASCPGNYINVASISQ